MHDIAKVIGKYQDALSALCGVDYAYMDSDKDVATIIELINLYASQHERIEELENCVEALRGKNTLLKICVNSVYGQAPIESTAKFKEFIKFVRIKSAEEFAERCKDLFPKEDKITRERIDNLLKEKVGENDATK